MSARLAVRLLFVLGGGLLALASVGCGWHSGRLVPANARSVGVEIFGLEFTRARVPVRDLEPEVHAEFSRAVSDLVDLPLVESSQADLVVRGRILQYRRRGGIRSAENELLETGVRIMLEAWLVDAKTGKELARTQSGLWSGHLVAGPESEREARARALESLCERMVLDLFAPSSYKPDSDARPDSEAEPDSTSDVSLLPPDPVAPDALKPALEGVLPAQPLTNESAHAPL